ncbi:hypothetical protein ACIQ9E_12415 [Streptomyces sp. NPDC094448]
MKGQTGFALAGIGVNGSRTGVVDPDWEPGVIAFDPDWEPGLTR